MKLTREQLFDSSNLNKNLKNRSVKGAAFTGFSQAAKIVIRIIGTGILARMLSPEDYGLVAMTVVITGFVSMFKDLGLSMATVQRDDINHQQVSTLFWINVALGGGLAVLVVFCSPLIAAFYDDQRLIGITIALAFTFFLGGFVLQPRALLKRHMAFKTLTIIEISAQLGGLICGVVMAKMGFGYWALVGQTFGAMLTETVAVWIAMPWIPSRPRRGNGVRSMVKFGTDIVIFNTVNYFARQMDNLLIGWYWGPEALAFYNKAYTLLLMPVKQINAPLVAVSAPALSRTQHQPAKFNSYFLKSIQLVSSVTIPLVFFVCIFADQVVYLWLGSDWMQSADLFRLLTVAAAVGAVSNPMGSLLLPLGLSARYKRIGFVNSGLIVCAFVVGLPFGAEGVAVAYSSASLLMLGPIWWFATRGTPVSFRNIFSTLTPSFTSTAVAAGVALLMLHFGSAVIGQTLIKNLIAVLLYGLVYLTMLLLVFKKLPFFLEIFKELKKKGG